MPRTALLGCVCFGLWATGGVAQVPPIDPLIASAAFGPGIVLNGTTTLTVTMTNTPLSVFNLTGVGFTDNLPAGLIVAPGGVMGSCSSGTAAAAAGTSVITVAGASLAPGSTCVLSVNVTGTALGFWDDPFVVSSDQTGGVSVDASIDVGAPAVTVAFEPPVIGPGGVSTLTLRIANPNSAPIPNASIFEAPLPIGLAFANPPNSSDSCGAAPSMEGLILALGSITIPPGSSCVLQVDVTGTALTTGIFSVEVLSAAGTGISNSAALTVTNVFPPGAQSFQEIGTYRRVGGEGVFILDPTRTYKWNQIFDPVTTFGVAGDMPVAGDWFGTGVVNIGVFHCDVGAAICQWQIDANNNGTWDGVAGGDLLWNFGIPGDVPVVGDWTGDGISKIGVMRCSVTPCQWILDAGDHHVFDASARFASYGLPGDVPVVNNWNGTGEEDQIGVFRGGEWIVDSNGNGTYDAGDAIYFYGFPGDLPLVGNWFAIGKKRIGVFRANLFAALFVPTTGAVILNLTGSNAFSASDFAGSFGLAGDIPVVGLWTIP